MDSKKDLKSSKITRESLYWSRRKFIKNAAHAVEGLHLDEFMDGFSHRALRKSKGPGESPALSLFTRYAHSHGRV